MHYISYFQRHQPKYPPALEERLFWTFRGVGAVSVYLDKIGEDVLTINNLIWFLKTFLEKSSCWAFPHHTGKVNHQDCPYRKDYIGCAHPELSGLFYAFTLASTVIEKATWISQDLQWIQTLIALMEADYSYGNEILAIMNSQATLGASLSKMRDSLIQALQELNPEIANFECAHIFDSDRKHLAH